MSLPHLQHLVCPICATHLVSTGHVLTCMNAHTFDIAREGYVNFLRKKLPGDTKEMLLARRNFLAQGHYLPISDALNEIIWTHLSAEGRWQYTSPMVILDAGCGEGYYLNRLQTHLAAWQVQTTCIGFDISKEAVRLAAGHCSDAFFVVVNLKERLALADRSLHVVLNIFAPRNPMEFARVIAPGGLLLVVIPAPTHLQQLRTALHLLRIERNKQHHVITQFTEQGRFRLETTTKVVYELHLRRNEIFQLVTMTPNYWHFAEEMRQAVTHLPEIRTEVACLCLAFRRQGS